MLDLEEIKKRCEAATPGPWNDDQNPCDDYWAENHPEDFEFIAHARSDIPALIAEVERLQSLEQTVQKFITFIYGGGGFPSFERAIYELHTSLKGPDA